MGLFGVLSVFGRRIKRNDTVKAGAGVDVQRHVAREKISFCRIGRPFTVSPHWPADFRSLSARASGQLGQRLSAQVLFKPR